MQQEMKQYSVEAVQCSSGSGALQCKLTAEQYSGPVRACFSALPLV
jgi:hypothetical protein